MNTADRKSFSNGVFTIFQPIYVDIGVHKIVIKTQLPFFESTGVMSVYSSSKYRDGYKDDNGIYPYFIDDYFINIDEKYRKSFEDQILIILRLAQIEADISTFHFQESEKIIRKVMNLAKKPATKISQKFAMTFEFLRNQVIFYHKVKGVLVVEVPIRSKIGPSDIEDILEVEVKRYMNSHYL